MILTRVHAKMTATAGLVECGLGQHEYSARPMIECRYGDDNVASVLSPVACNMGTMAALYLTLPLVISPPMS